MTLLNTVKEEAIAEYKQELRDIAISKCDCAGVDQQAFDEYEAREYKIEAILKTLEA